MGKFTYDRLATADFEDRLLRHLQIVIGAKMRRGESFQFTWNDDKSVGAGRTAVWIHPGLCVAYKFYGGKEPAVNPAWVDALMHTANSSKGLHIVPEPAPQRPLEARRVLGVLHDAY